MCDKRDRAITCVFCRDLHFTLTLFGLLQKDLKKEGEFWRKGFSNKIIVTLIKQGFTSSFLSRPVA